MAAARFLVLPALGFLLSACSANDRPGFEHEEESPTEPPSESPPSPPPGEFGDQVEPADPEEVEINEVYGHSPTTLYKLEPKTKAVTVVGNFQGCGQVTDIALDESSTMYGVSSSGLYVIDKDTAGCTRIKGGSSYPNSLSFVPKGTLDPDHEALVGYQGAQYVRIDVQTGAIDVIGTLGAPNLVSSGDIVSVKGGNTYLTVKGGSCNTHDCLVEVDPKTGKLLKDWGSIEHKNVFGIAFWGGNVYGFDEQGTLFEVTFGKDQLSTQSIAIPQRPSGLKFWGAGSSTSAPLDFGPQ